MPDFHKALSKKELEPGHGRSVQLAGKSVAVFNTGGACHAIGGTCPHLGGPLGDGGLDGGVVACPWHGWVYDLATGACKNNPKVSVPVYPVKIEGDDILVQL